jgi:hypothetical protein
MIVTGSHTTGHIEIDTISGKPQPFEVIWCSVQKRVIIWKGLLRIDIELPWWITQSGRRAERERKLHRA